MTKILTLSAGELSLDLAPAIGGAIAGFRHGDFDLMRPTPEAAISKGLVRQASCYPLLPYSNRIAHGRFTFGDETHQLTHNFGDHPHSIHGNSWQRAWTIAEMGRDRAVLTLEHSPFGFGPSGWDGWPYRFKASQVFELSEAGFAVTLTIENVDERAMPAGLGWHPFFPAHPGTELRFGATGVWINGADSLPVSLDPVRPEWDYSAGKALGEPNLDNVFAGWGGSADIAFVEDGLGLTVTADPLFTNAVVYIPKGRGFFAFEPVSHMTDAVNRMERPDHGLRVLAPGESLSGTMRIGVARL